MQVLAIEHIPTWPRMLAKCISALSIAVGSTFLLGWIFYMWLPKEFLTVLIAIKPNAAICFILTGSALWVSCEKRESYVRYLAEFFSSFVFLIAMITLFEYFFHVNLGIDQGIFKEPLTPEWEYPPPGRMSPFVAVNFALIGATLFFLNNRLVSYRVRQIFVAIVIIISFFEFLSRIYRIDDLSEILGLSNKFSQLELVTSMICVLLGLGILFARPRYGIVSILISRDSGGVLARRLIIPAIILPIGLGYIGLFGLAEKWVGFRDAEFGTSVLVMGTILFFSGLILVNSYLISRVEKERKRAEQALKLSQMQLQSILDHASAVMYVYDLEGRCVLVNKQFEKLFHKSSAEIIGKKTQMIFSEEFATHFNKNNQKVLETRKPLTVEEHIPEGNEIHTYLSNKFPLFDEHGLPYGVGGISSDITEIKRMHELLQESEERFSLALSSAEAGTWSWDVPRNLVVWDDYMHYLFGLRPGSFPGQEEAFLNLVHPDDRGRVTTEIQDILNKGTDYETEFRKTYLSRSFYFTFLKTS